MNLNRRRKLIFTIVSMCVVRTNECTICYIFQLTIILLFKHRKETSVNHLSNILRTLLQKKTVAKYCMTALYYTIIQTFQGKGIMTNTRRKEATYV